LWSMVDPYAYREKLAIPKLIVNGNNDQYWSTDALNLYWDDLTGDKWVMYVPNAGHNLEQRLPGGVKDRARALNGIAAFARYQVCEKSMPKLEWKHSSDGDKLLLTVDASEPPRAARIWAAEADTPDFRQSPWREKGVRVDRNRVTGEVDAPKDGCLAFFGEVEYEIDGIRYQLSTQLRVAGKPVEK